MAKYNQSQIIKILKEHKDGKAILDICKEYNISVPTFYVWKRKYYNQSLAETNESRILHLEKENAKLRDMYVELSMDCWGRRFK